MKYYDRVYANIHLDAISHNICQIKNKLSKEIQICSVVKADGYGHGAVPIAKEIEPFVWGYAVATVEEGIQLRKHQIEKPILLLGYHSSHHLEEIIEHEIRATVFQWDVVEELSKRAVAMNKIAYVHIKIDTGMGRIGLMPNEAVSFIEQVSTLPNIIIEGVFTHLSTADEIDKSYSHYQLEQFYQVRKELEQKQISIPYYHYANSASIIEFNCEYSNLVRVGISQYGLYPSEEVKKSNLLLKSALELKSQVIYVKEVEAGNYIGYGATYQTSKKTKIATIPVGYGDGYPRNLSNKGEVLIRGKRASIIGRVCMDQFMVDVTHIEDVAEGDMVTLIGKDGKEEITVEEVATKAGIFNYELICILGKRIPRVYMRNNKVIGCKDYFEDTYENFYK